MNAATLDSQIGGPPRQAVLVVNTKSRRGQEWFQDAQQALHEQGIEVLRANRFRSVSQLSLEVQRAIRERAPMIVAGGGDGTFSAIARHFVGSNTALGILPLGTGNAFARDLGIPANLQEACRIVGQGKLATVDLGIAGDDYFVNVATAGLTTRIAQAITDPMKKRFGRFVYAAALLRGLARVHPFHVEIETEHGVEAFDTLQVVIGNGRFHAGPFPLAPHASITEGMLSIYALDTTSKAAFLKLAMYLPTGRHIDLPEVHFQDTRGGMIRTFPPMPVTVDGEICAHTPLQFGIAPDAIRVVVPQDFKGNA